MKIDREKLKRKIAWDLDHNERRRLSSMFGRLSYIMIQAPSSEILEERVYQIVEEMTKEEAVMLLRTVSHLTERVFLKEPPQG